MVERERKREREREREENGRRGGECSGIGIGERWREVVREC